jgi:DNA-binding response OmpR family regulator
MARILISESQQDVRKMLTRMVTRAGHEAITATVPAPEDFLGADVLVVEPASPLGAVLAQAATVLDPSLPLICASIAEPPAELIELGITFAATLLKPFTSEELGAAIDRALDRHTP